MDTSMRIDLPREQIVEFCQRWNLTELSLFGSVLREDFRTDSDVDILISFAATAKPSLVDLTAMKEELQGIFGRQVDLVERRVIELSQNYIRRKQILDSAKVVYAA